jgi:hypothetical protein
VKSSRHKIQYGGCGSKEILCLVKNPLRQHYNDLWGKFYRNSKASHGQIYNIIYITPSFHGECSCVRIESVSKGLESSLSPSSGTVSFITLSHQLLGMEAETVFKMLDNNTFPTQPITLEAFMYTG